MLRISLLLSFLFVVSWSNAQQELGLHFMQDVWQVNRTNPAIIADSSRVSIGGSVYGDFTHTGPGINDFIVEEDGVTKIKVNQLIDALEDTNTLRYFFEWETFNLRLRFNQLSFSLGHAIKNYTTLDYPKELVKLIGEGNSQYIGEEVFFGPSIDIMAYNEYALGAAWQHERFSIGAKAKHLSGIGSISTPKNDASLYTDNDIYQLTIKTDYEVQASSFLDYTNGTFDSNTGDIIFKGLFSKNRGVAFDIGLQAKLTPKLKVAVSLLDVGGITWEENSRTYRTNVSKVFEGTTFDLSSLLLGDTINIDNPSDTYTFDSIFEIEESTNSFNTNLAKRMYGSIVYDFNDRLQLGALVFAQAMNDETLTAYSFSARYRLRKSLILGAVYSIRNIDVINFDVANNLGLNISGKFGPVQVFATTDNLFSVFSTATSKNVNARAGFNILF